MKPTKTILKQRLDEIMQIRLDGATIHDCGRYVAECEAENREPWAIADGGRPVSERTIWRYIQQTDRMIAEECRESRKRMLRRHLAQRRNLYAKAVNQGDLRAALSILDSEAKLVGLFEDELTRQIDELQKQLEEIKANGIGGNKKASESDSCRRDVGSSASGAEARGQPG